MTLSRMEKKKSSIFGNRIAEKIATSIVHCQTFELGRTQLDPSPDMNNYTFKKKRYPFWTVCVYGRVCFKCLMTYDVTIISAMSYPEIKLFFSAILIMSLPQAQQFFSPTILAIPLLQINGHFFFFRNDISTPFLQYFYNKS